MPTPIGHTLAGYAAAKLTRVQIGSSERQLFIAAAAFGVLPDVLGRAMEVLIRQPEHGLSHSVLAMAVVSLLAAWLWSRRGLRFWPVLVFVAAAYGSHLVADLLRPAPTATAGEQLLWPLQGSYAVDLDILPHVPKRESMSAVAFVGAILKIMIREVLVLGPIALACRFIRPAIPTRPVGGLPSSEGAAAA